MFRRILIGMILIGMLAGCGGDSKPAPTPTQSVGTVLEPPIEVGNFTLTDQTGQPFRLSDLSGKVVIVYFGYTFCPDVCPTTLAHYKQVKADLGDEADQMAVVMISVDGERDTPERLAHYLGAFDPGFIGLTSDDTTIRTVAKDFGVFYQRQTYDNTQADYLVDHTASTFIVGPAGDLRIIYPYGTDPAIMADGIRMLLKS